MVRGGGGGILIFKLHIVGVSVQWGNDNAGRHVLFFNFIFGDFLVERIYVGIFSHIFSTLLASYCPYNFNSTCLQIENIGFITILCTQAWHKHLLCRHKTV